MSTKAETETGVGGEAPSAAAKSARTIVGRVVGNKANQSVSVVIERLIRHPAYGKFVRRTTKVLAHDEANSCKQGDTVALRECRPISKRKAWRVVEIGKPAEPSETGEG